MHFEMLYLIWRKWISFIEHLGRFYLVNDCCFYHLILLYVIEKCFAYTGFHIRVHTVP